MSSRPGSGPRPLDAAGAVRSLAAGEGPVAGLMRDLALERLARTDRPATIATRPRSDRELHALIVVGAAVSAAGRIEDVVEVAAEEACAAVDAASVSISRWEVERRALRTLRNVGDLGPGEERAPADEVYRLDDDAAVRRLIESGATYVMSVDDPDVDPLERELMLALGKHHCVGVPIMVGGTSWGEIWATRTVRRPGFGPDDARFLGTVAGLVAGAVGQAALVGHVAELARRDPLTGVVNRRGFDERLEAAVGAAAGGGDVALVLCDLDGLKEINDAGGHEAGDRALQVVVGLLDEQVDDDVLVARIGGDEFGLLVDRAGTGRARELAERVVSAARAVEDERIGVSCGVASLRSLGVTRPGELLRGADAALYTAKRGGRGRVCVAEGAIEARLGGAGERRRTDRERADADAPAAGGRGSVPAAPLLERALDALDGPARRRPTLVRLETVATAAARTVDAGLVSVSRRAAGDDAIETMFTWNRRSGASSGARYGTVGELFASADYPASARILGTGGAVVVRADDPAADPAERAMVVEYGMAAVLMAAATDAAGAGWLVEVFADADSADLAAIASQLRLLVPEALR